MRTEPALQTSKKRNWGTNNE